jgi:hypothetical protein
MKSVKIHLYTICWNEEKMMPHFLKHYSEFCDEIFIYDNFSNDDTAAICQSFPKVNLLQYDSGNEIRDDIYLIIKNSIWKKSRGVADFVIICDVDEFLYHQDLKGYFENLKETGITIMKAYGYDMISEKYPSPEDNLFSSIKEGVRSINFDKVILFDPNKIDEINYSPGAHGCFPVGLLKYPEEPAKLLHYKYLGLEEIINRYSLMSKRLSAFNKKFSFGFHYSFSRNKIIKEFNGLWKKKHKII